MQLGDDMDDFCSRCKRGLDHAVVSMEGEEVRMVRCRTCGFEHKYRHNKSGRKEMMAEEAFQKVMASVTGQMGGGAAKTSKKKARKRA